MCVYVNTLVHFIHHVTMNALVELSPLNVTRYIMCRKVGFCFRVHSFSQCIKWCFENCEYVATYNTQLESHICPHCTVQYYSAINSSLAPHKSFTIYQSLYSNTLNVDSVRGNGGAITACLYKNTLELQFDSKNLCIDGSMPKWRHQRSCQKNLLKEFICHYHRIFVVHSFVLFFLVHVRFLYGTLHHNSNNFSAEILRISFVHLQTISLPNFHSYSSVFDISDSNTQKIRIYSSKEFANHFNCAKAD